LLRPRLKRIFQTYQVILAKDTDNDLKEKEDTEQIEDSQDSKILQKAEHSTSQNIHQLEKDVARQTKQLTRVLRWEPMLGVVVLICTGLMNVFGGTLQPVTTSQNSSLTPQIQVSPTEPERAYKTAAPTTDLRFMLLLTITPDSPGTNVFNVQVLDGYDRQVINVSVSLSLTANTSTTSQVIKFRPDGLGGFTAQANLATSGYWIADFQVRTPDNILHNASTAISS
jgi:hypothetical protein